MSNNQPDASFARCASQVRALQDFHRKAHQSAFNIEHSDLERGAVLKRFEGLLPVRNRGDVYHAFVSYRCVSGPSRKPQCNATGLFFP